MRRLFLTFVIGFTAIAFSAAVITSADARSRGKKKYGKARTLTIQKRSFLDSGKHPLPYATRNYVIMDTHLGTPAYGHQGSLYGGDVLPGRFGAFGPKY